MGGGKSTNELLSVSGWNSTLVCGSGGDIAVAANITRTFLRERRTPRVLDGVWGGDEGTRDACLCPIGLADTTLAVSFGSKEVEAGSGASGEAFAF